MKAENYHQVMAAIDRALDVFAQSAGHLSAEDLQMKSQLEQVRGKIVKAETGNPFPFKGSAPLPPATAPDPHLTQAPWTKLR